MKKLQDKDRWHIFSGNALKFIAMITMIVDHIGAAWIEIGILRAQEPKLCSQILSTQYGMHWYSVDMVLRGIGRISFPIFCFLLAEGFFHTRNSKKYFLRLALFALLSEIPFDMAFSNTFLEFQYQNVFFTLAIGVGVLLLIRRFENQPWLKFLSLLSGCALAYLLHTDYNMIGVLLIVVFYLLRQWPLYQKITAGILIAYETWLNACAGVLALIPISLYNGQRGRLNLKYVFYFFYPVHLLLLVLLRYLTCGLPLG